MHDIPFCRMNEALTLPFVIHHMIAAHPQLQGFFRQPEMWNNDVLFFLIPWWENQNHGCQVACAGEV